MARLRVLQRSIPGEPDGPLFVHGDLRVDIMAHRVTIRNRLVDLTPTEEAVFYIFVRHAGKLVTTRHLLRCVWGTDAEEKIHDLHVYVRSLRRKLNGAADESVIQTEGSAGYRLSLPPDCLHSLAESTLSSVPTFA
jgi:two-component system KDP operon response regulator KdpE